MNVFRAACLNPVRHYRLPLGLLRPGDPADFIVAENIDDLRILETWRRGRRVAWNGRCPLPHHAPPPCNRFETGDIPTDRLRLPWTRGRAARVIEVIEGKVITGADRALPAVRAGCLAPAPERDLLKLVVLNRYRPAPPAQALVRGFGLARGALASSVAHDAHNVIAVGASDEDLAAVLRAVTEARGGLAAAANGQVDLLPLPVAGLMSNDTCPRVAVRYEALHRAARRLGGRLQAPFMALSFLALPVIPRLKLTDLGLFDAENFHFVDLASDR